MALSNMAWTFAENAHRGQMYGRDPYMLHVWNVVLVVQAVTDDPDMVSAAFLHDVLEDTNTTREQVLSTFGPRVEAMVWACTGVGANRRERNTSIHAKLEALPEALLVKVADRIANVESCWENRDSRLFMYHREYPEFRKLKKLNETTLTPLATLWERLDALMGWRER